MIILTEEQLQFIEKNFIIRAIQSNTYSIDVDDDGNNIQRDKLKEVTTTEEFLECPECGKHVSENECDGGFDSIWIIEHLKTDHPEKYQEFMQLGK